MLNTLNLLLLGTTQKTVITSWSFAVLSLLVVEYSPGLPNLLSAIGYILAGAAVAMGCFYMGRLLAQHQEQEDNRSYEAYLAYAKKYQEKYHFLRQNLKDNLRNVG